MKKSIAAFFSILSIIGVSTAREQKEEKSAGIVRIGAVASEGKVTVFKNLKTHLNRNGYPSDYVLYSSYDALVDALDRGEIDVAWNSPLSHAQYHIRNQCTSQTLAMREGDLNLRHVLIARADSGIDSLADLPGKRLILDKSKYQHELVSSEHLKSEGVKLGAVTVISEEKKSADSAMKALAEGKADAAEIRANAWKKASENQEKHPGLKLVWTSPTFNHCVFTAAQDFDRELGEKFTNLLTTMDPNDPLIAELNRLEHTRKWLPGDSKGFESLVKALQEKEASSNSTGSDR